MIPNNESVHEATKEETEKYMETKKKRYNVFRARLSHRWTEIVNPPGICTANIPDHLGYTKREAELAGQKWCRTPFLSKETPRT